MFERLAEFTRDTLYLSSGIHISGNNELIIDNCRRIEEYNEVFMRLIAGGLCVDIRGDGLRAYDFKTGGLIIRGRITHIELSERSGRHEETAETPREDKR